MGKLVSQEHALQKAASKLDISPSKYKQAMQRFESMKAYLINCKYDGTIIKPEIYLHGSFKLGTEVRPYKNSKDADYDIDIVCRLGHIKENISPKIVKHQVGEVLKNNLIYAKMLDKEGRRCWTINYKEQDGIGFHMDILPSVLENSNILNYISSAENTIAITNKEADSDIYTWKSSNPRDFAKWFYEKNQYMFENLKNEQKRYILENLNNDGLFLFQDDIPDIHVKTPLQRTIQLLKRHRDICFSSKSYEKFKPISMIITSLAAQIYKNEISIIDTINNLINILSEHGAQMSSSFKFNEADSQNLYPLITRTPDGKWYVPNPVNPKENFADKWHEVEDGIPHARAAAFFQWIKWAKEDFKKIASDIDENYYIDFLINNQNNNYQLPSQSNTLLSNIHNFQNPPWPMLFTYSVHIQAKYKSGTYWRLFSPEDRLHKHLKLMFAATTNAIPPFQVYWQVVNTGKEAEDANCLRGEIYISRTAGLGGLINYESTLYSGDHWIECFIVKTGVCVARSGRFMVRIL